MCTGVTNTKQVNWCLKLKKKNPVATGQDQADVRFPRKSVIFSLHPNISIHILYSLLYTFLLILKRRICLTIKAAYMSVGDQFPCSRDLDE